MSKRDKAAAPAITASLRDLERAHLAREQAERQELEAVWAARRAGASWVRIGEVYGLTKQGAQQRFKAHLPTIEDPTTPNQPPTAPESRL